MNPVWKIVISALLIFAISEVAKRYTLAGSILASVPLVSVLAMIWLYRETGEVARIARFSSEVFWLVIPSLVLFALLPVLLLKFRMGFYAALGVATGASVAGYFVMVLALKKFGGGG